MKKRLICTALLAVMLLALPLMRAYAEQPPYEGYTYDNNRDEQPSPALYTPLKVINPEMESPNVTDIFAYESKIYALESSTGTCLVYDENLNQTGELAFKDETGANMSFVQMGGLFICNLGIYVSDPASQCLYKFSHDGVLQQTYEKPVSSLYDDSIAFSASKIAVDSGGNVYAVVPGLYAGAVMFAPNGSFLGFFGASEVEMTLEMRLDQTWKRMLTEEQAAAMTRFVPVAYTSFDIDSENFVYTCSRNAASITTRVRKLNPAGVGLWDELPGGQQPFFGDTLSDEVISGLSFDSQLVDIDVTQSGFINVLDAARGRVFEYDANGQLLGVFGGAGNQNGTFVNAAALDAIGDRVYVLDAGDSSITSFEITEYGALMHEAFLLYNGGEYENALPLWRRVYAMNNLSQPAATGIGKALMQRGDVSGALAFFRTANNRSAYSEAFEDYRFTFMRQNFALMMLVLALVITGVLLFRRFRKNRVPKPRVPHFAMLKAPGDTIQELIYAKQLSIKFTAAVAVYWFVLEIVKYFGTGFVFNQNDPYRFNIFLPLVSTVVAYVLFCTANWGVSTLSQGKGSLKTIFTAGSYVLLPYLITQTICLVLSLVLVQSEGMFITMISAAGLFWSVVLLFIVMTQIHDFALGKAFGNLLLTVLGMAVVLFLLFMCVVLFEHVANLFMIVFNEITLRM